MFEFFKNKNKKISAVSRTFIFVFAFLIVFGGVFLVLGNTEAHARDHEDEDRNPTINTPPPTSNIETSSCGWDLVQCAAEEAAQAMLWITSWALYASSAVLTAIIQWSVVDMGKYINSDGVIAAWQTFRDLANMFFIFIVLYIAINTILGTGGVDLKKMLARIIIVALLLNFSFFFTKIVVDASNIVAIGFHNQILKTECGVGPDRKKVEDIGEAFMCKMGLASFYDTDSVKSYGAGATVGGILLSGLMGSLFFLITAFVFFAAAIMFIARLVTLIFIFILSPLAFAATALPKDKYSKEWFDKLAEVCIWPPAFMAMIWATLTVLDAVALKPTATLSQAVRGASVAGGTRVAAEGAGDVLLNYAIIIGLIIGSLIVAKKLGAYGAGGALKSLGKAGKWTQGQLGRGAVRASGIGTLDNYIKSTNAGNTRIGRGLRGMTTGLITDQKFGTKESVSSMDKKTKKADEKSAEQIAKNKKTRIEKEADADINNTELHSQRLTTLQQEHGKTEETIALGRQSALDQNKRASDRSLTPEERQIHENNIVRITNNIAALERTRKEQESEIKKQEALVERSKKGEGANKEEKQAALNAEADQMEKRDKEGNGIGLRTRVAGAVGAVGGAGLGAAIGGTLGGGFGAIPGAVVGGYWGRWAAKVPVESGDMKIRKAVVEQLRGKKKGGGGGGNAKFDLDDVVKTLENERGGLDDDDRAEISKAAGIKVEKKDDEE